MSKIKSSIKKQKTEKSQRSTLHKLIIRGLSLCIVGALGLGYFIYSSIFKSNIKTPNQKIFDLYIPSNASFSQVKDSLFKYDIIINHSSFEWVANKKNYPNLIKGGRYTILDGMSNNQIVDLLRSGKQNPIQITFNNIQNLDELFASIGKQIEANPNDLRSLLANDDFLDSLGIEKNQEYLLFLPDTYFSNWNTSARQFIYRMKKESNKFWNTKRKEKSEQLKLAPFEVQTLASIVQKESNISTERPLIASVYLNRLKLGMPLGADPTIIFAHQMSEDTIRRILSDLD
ncbi:MAG: endolytic transglycosylase MltG, partial [Bacteroidales bacterium]